MLYTFELCHMINIMQNDRKLLTRLNFYVKIDDKYSTSRILKEAIPLGSVIGPLLYNIYVHNIPEKSRNFFTPYDDTGIAVSICQQLQEAAILLQKRKFDKSICIKSKW